MSRKPIPKSKSNRKPFKTLKLGHHGSSTTDGPEPPMKRYRPSFALSNPPIFDITKDDSSVPPSSQSFMDTRSPEPALQSQRSLVDIKGKNKETRPLVDDEGDGLWVDKYEPTAETELAVHKRKVDDVRRWLLEAFEGGPSGKLCKYRRVLALTGPAGTAKTTTLRVLSKELNFNILEWRNTTSERGPPVFTTGGSLGEEELDFDTETLFDKFQAFLTRATTCNSIFGDRNVTQRPHAYSQTQASQISTHCSGKRQLVLLEDLPNLLHLPTQARFQAVLRSICTPTFDTSESGPPIVIVLSDSGVRAEHPDDRWDSNNWRRWNKEVLDIRNVLGRELLTSPYVTCIKFNPIAPTLMTKALQALLASHFGSSEARENVGKQPAREVIDIIVESSNGDIRSAIMALQFACVVDLSPESAKSKKKVTRKRRGGTRPTGARAVLEAVTRREQSLVLFHLMGKILYNKRKLDPPASHLSARDAAKEHELDMHLTDPPPLPRWLSHHNRKASRVCIETLAAESPVDSSLLGMYAHQNYTQFCTDIDQCDGVCEGLSWVDCMEGSAPCPYAFPTLTLSTLHSLPTPVPRRGQKVCKPAWFDAHSKETEASDAIGDMLGWLGRGMGVGVEMDKGASSISVGKWTHASVATELGGWLRALDRCSGGGSQSQQGGSLPQPPRTYRLFSHLPWSLETAGGDALGENEDGEEGDAEGEEDMRLPGGVRDEEEGKGWLEDDDIEDVE